MADENCDENIHDNKRLKISETEVENQITTTTIETLNDDCLREIFSYFSFIETINLDMVCMRWSSLCERNWEKVLGLSTARSVWYFQDEQDRLHEESISEIMLERILRRCGNLVKFLELSWFDAAICMDQLQIILPLCPDLQCVTLNAVPSAIAMRSLRDNCVNLKCFAIEGISHSLENDLSIMLSNNQKLKEFSIRSSLGDTTGEFLKNLPCDTIQEITLGTDFIFATCNFNSSMQKFNYLRTFSYEPSNRFETSIMVTISERTSLTNLSLRHNYLSNVVPDAYNHLSNLINLEVLDLWFARDLSEEAFINIVNSCTQLESLSIGFCLSITNDAIRAISKLTKLRTLRMEHLCKVTDEPLGDLPETLEVLICSHSNRVKNYGILRLIERAPKLRDLALDGCAITKDIVQATIDIIKRRTNGIVLEMDIHGNGFLSFPVTEMPPLLRIVTAIIYDQDLDTPE